MIRLTRLNGTEFSLNPDLIHRAEETPDTVLTLIDGSRYVVTQSLSEIVDSVVAYRARVVAEANRLTAEGEWVADDDADERRQDQAHHDGADVVELRTRRA
ncbi:flagellar FlbD family protein [Aquipuribacter nitratireducens]|uniref:Flagellar FlbD family protein n=1 Tax=Aquipuribacter nitratireducens TaxID=650104 RepID=A0ABW0GRC4_9MICO